MATPTRIDTLEIRIQSDSRKAAEGIEELAIALGDLKNNGKITTAINNLNNLSRALQGLSNITSSAVRLSDLAKSIREISQVGSMSKVVNQLSKLPGALNGLSTMTVDSNLGPKLASVASAVAPLSNIKAGGLPTLINSLRRLDEVTDKLDDGSIGRFADRIKALTTAVTPLSQQMTSIQSGLKAVNSNARTAGSGVKHFGDKVNVTTFNLSNMINVVRGVVSVLRPVIRLLSNAISEAIEWDGISNRFGRGFGSEAPEVYAWVQRLNEEMGINTQQFMQYSSTYANMLTGFGVAHEDATQMALGYTELTYDLWAANNDIYKSFDDAASAVRSAVAGEVEPIRRAGFTIIESTLEMTAANHGLDISIEKATESQKSYLRYLTLVDQAHAQNMVGTYAKEMNTAEGVMRTFSQQLKSLAQAFGSLFLPILVKVMPWLQAFVELLMDGIHAVAKFFGIEIQSVDFSGYTGGLNGITDSADGAGDALGDTTGAMKDATKAAEDLKKATIGIDELNVISPPKDSKNDKGNTGWGNDGTPILGDLGVGSLWDEAIFDGIQSKVDELKERIKQILPVVGGIAAALAGWRLMHLLDDIDDVDLKLPKLSKTIKGLGKGLAIAGITVAVGKLVWDFTGAYLEGGDEAGLLKAFGTTVLGTALAAFLAGKVGAGIVLTVSGVVMLSRLIVELKEGTLEWNDPKALITGLVGLVETAIGGAITWKTIGPFIKSAVTKLIPKIGPMLSGLIPKITAALAAIPGWGWIAAAVVALVGGAIALALADYDFTEIGYKIGEVIGKAVRWLCDGASVVWGWIVDLGEAIGDWINDAVLWCMDTFTLENIEKFIGWICDPETWSEIIWPKMKEIAQNIWDGLWEGLGEVTKNLWGNITEFVDGLVQGFQDGFGIHSPSTVMRDQVGKFLLEGILAALSFDAIKERIKGMWGTATSWWDNNKGTLNTYTPSIGSIKSKLSSAWSTAKTWWSKNKGTLSYTPTIGSIKSKLSSAWSTAKKWWNDHVKLSIPSLSLKVTYTTSGLGTVKKAIVKALGLSGWPKLSFAANGGIFNAGSLIWAGERGAEIVANAGGGRTGVMNVDQMQEAVYEGVYAAVMSAMRATAGEKGDTAVNVYLDGRQLTSSVERRQHERGASIMGNQVYAY